MTTARRAPEVLLRRYWEEPDTPVVTAGLSALSVGYRLALWARERAYRWGVLETGRLPCPVISVGNITLGGSGKTPTVELAVLTLQELGAVPAIVSRGYGRAGRGVRIVADREGIKLRSREAGDEPMLLAERLPGVPVVVGESKYEAGRVAVERCGATVIVIDDGFQQRAVAKDLEIVVVQGRAPWGNRHVFPRGTLREPLSALSRADLVLVTNPSGSADVDSIAAVVRRQNPRAPVLTAAYQLLPAQEVRAGRQRAAHELAGRRLLAFAGLGSPRGFADTLAGAGIRVAGLVEFPDHHWFTAEDVRDLARQATAASAEGLITTEKDWVRLRTQPVPPFPLWILPVKLTIESGHEAWTHTLAGVLTSAPARPAP